MTDSLRTIEVSKLEVCTSIHFPFFSLSYFVRSLLLIPIHKYRSVNSPSTIFESRFKVTYYLYFEHVGHQLTSDL